MKEVDFLVIGSGAAGLTAALYGARSGLNTVVLDGAGAGGQVLQIDNLENYPGVFPAINGNELIKKMEDQAKAFGVSFFQETAASIDKSGDFFIVKTSSEEYKAYSVLLATGAEHRKLGVKGEKEFFGRGVSYCAVCDGPFFKGKTVVVVGGGDSACTEAIYLSKLASRVILVHRREVLRAQKTVQDRIFSNSKIEVIFNSVVNEIKSGEKGTVGSVVLENTKDKSLSEIKTDAVFIFTGLSPRTGLLEILKKDEGGYIVTDENMATAVPGLFCAGDVRSKPLRQIVTACSDGAVAAFSAEKYVEAFKEKSGGSK